MFSGIPGSRPLTLTLQGASLNDFFVGGKPKGSHSSNNTQLAGWELRTSGLEGIPTIAPQAENVLNLYLSPEAIS